MGGHRCRTYSAQDDEGLASPTMDLAEGYGEASHAFLLKDFAKTRSILRDLVERIEGDEARPARITQEQHQHSQHTGEDVEITEVARKIWILQITLVASDTAPASNTSNTAAARQPSSAS